MRWNPFRRADNAGATDSSFESTVVDDVAGARAGASQTAPSASRAGVAAATLDDLDPAGDLPSPRTPAAASPGAPAPASAAALIVDSESIGHVGRYALKTVLGQGGLGTVYAAWDPLLSRTVALKTVHIDADPAARDSMDALFLNEARAAAGLSHPHIVTVFDAGPSDSGVYIAMERLQGQDLRHLLQQGVRPGPIEAAQVVRRVADALAYAHRKGVVHCDVKPANIFMTGRMHPKVLDFGIARVAHREASPLLEGMAAGSPYYLAPEQLDGRSVDRRSDVYSLGVVLYELLTGKKPFEGKSLEEITNAVRAGDFVPANRVSPKVPLGLSVIASRAMARDPDQRYPSARHLSMELRHWVDSAEARALLNGAKGTVARKPAAGVRVARIGVPVAAVAVVGALWWFKSESPADGPVATAPPAASAVAARPPAVVPSAAAAAVAPVATAATAAAAEPAASALAAPADAQAQAPSAGQEPAASTTLVAAADAAQAASASARAAERASAAAAKAEARKRKAAASVAAVDAAPATVAPSLGVVQLAVSPWGQIEVDGRPLGTSPPLTRLTLPAGAHTVTVRNDDFPPYSTTLTVSSENPVTLRHRFGP